MATTKAISTNDNNSATIVNTDKASRGVWLVKVPRYLSEVWEKKAGEVIGKLIVSGGETTFHSNIEQIECETPSNTQHLTKSINGKSNLNEAKAIAVGTGVKRPGAHMEIPLQHKFIIRNVESAHQSLAVLSEDKSNLEEEAEFRTGKLSIEGRIVIRAECQPPNSIDYMRMKVQQIQRLSQPKKTVQQMERAVVKFKPVNVHQEHVEKDKAKKEGVKAVRLERDEVSKLLFHAFEKHQFYRQADLQKLTNQPAGIIKDLLNDIGLYHDSHPHKAMWELKPEYRNYNKEFSKKIESELQR